VKSCRPVLAGDNLRLRGERRIWVGVRPRLGHLPFWRSGQANPLWVSSSFPLYLPAIRSSPQSLLGLLRHIYTIKDPRRKHRLEERRSRAWFFTWAATATISNYGSWTTAPLKP